MFTVCHKEEAELLPPQLLPRCPVYDTILIWFLILFPVLSRSFWQVMDRSDQLNFPPQRFPTKSVLTARKSRQKGREWWVGLKMDLKQNRADFLSINTFPPKPTSLCVRAGRVKKYHSGWYFWPTTVRNFWLCRNCCFSKTLLECLEYFQSSVLSGIGLSVPLMMSSERDLLTTPSVSQSLGEFCR